jgi:hypothetical protein
MHNGDTFLGLNSVYVRQLQHLFAYFKFLSMYDHKNVCVCMHHSTISCEGWQSELTQLN